MAILTLFLGAACLLTVAPTSDAVDVDPKEFLNWTLAQNEIYLTNDDILRSKHALKGKFETRNGLHTYVTGNNNATKSIVLIDDVYGFAAHNLKHADALAAAGQFLVVLPDVYGWKKNFDKLTGPKGRMMDKFMGMVGTFCRFIMFGMKEVCPESEEETTTTTAAPPAAQPYPHWYPQYAAAAPAAPPPAPAGRRKRAATAVESSDCTPPALIPAVQEVFDNLVGLVKALPASAGKRPGIFAHKEGALVAIDVIVNNPDIFQAGMLLDPEDLLVKSGGCGIKFPMKICWAVSEKNYPKIRPVLMKTFDMIHEQIYPKAEDNFFALRTDTPTAENKKAIDDVISEAVAYFREHL